MSPQRLDSNDAFDPVSVLQRSHSKASSHLSSSHCLDETISQLSGVPRLMLHAADLPKTSFK